MRQVGSDTARTRFRDLLDEVEHHGEHVEILRYNTPAAVIVPHAWYEQALASISQPRQGDGNATQD